MNTIFLRLEAPLQSWGYNARFVFRQTDTEPTKSGVMGLICACLGLNRKEAPSFLKDINLLEMGVRVDKPGILLIDYQNVNVTDATTANMKNDKVSKSGAKPQKDNEQLYKQYLADASFLVALRGNEEILLKIKKALTNPVFTPYLGRKCCPPSQPIFTGLDNYPSLVAALNAYPYLTYSMTPLSHPLRGLIEVNQYEPNVIVKRDVLVSLIPQIMENRLVKYIEFNPPLAEKIDWRRFTSHKNENSIGKQRKQERRIYDEGLCVLCKLPVDSVHHITYDRFNNEDVINDLRSLCKLCHDATSSIEYERNMGSQRLDPFNEQDRKDILERRKLFIIGTRNV